MGKEGENVVQVSGGVDDKRLISIRKLVDFAIKFAHNDAKKLQYITEFLQQIVRNKIEKIIVFDFAEDDKSKMGNRKNERK